MHKASSSSKTIITIKNKNRTSNSIAARKKSIRALLRLVPKVAPVRKNSQPLRLAQRRSTVLLKKYKLSSALRTARTQPVHNKADFPPVKIVAAIRPETWTHRVYKAPNAKEFNFCLHNIRYDFRPVILPTPDINQYALIKSTPRILAYGRKNRLSTQKVLAGIFAGPYRRRKRRVARLRIAARTLNARALPRYLSVLQRQIRRYSAKYLFRRKAFNKTFRVRAIKRRALRVFYIKIGRASPRRVIWCVARRRAFAAEKPQLYKLRRYYRSHAIRKSSRHRVIRHALRRITRFRAGQYRRVRYWRKRPNARKLRASVLISHYIRTRHNCLRRARFLAAQRQYAHWLGRLRIRQKRRKQRRLKRKKRLIYKAYKQRPAIRRVLQRRKPLKQNLRQQGLLKQQRRKQQLTRRRRLKQGRIKRRLRVRHRISACWQRICRFQALRALRVKRASHLTGYVTKQRSSFTTNYRTDVPPSFNLPAKAVLRSRWWRLSRTWLAGVKPFFIRKFRRLTVSAPRSLRRRKRRRRRLRRARRFARTIRGRATYWRYFRKGKGRKYYRSAPITLAKLAGRWPQECDVLVGRTVSRYRQRWWSLFTQRKTEHLLYTRHSRSRRRVTRRVFPLKIRVRRRRSRRFLRSRRTLTRFLSKKTAAVNLWARVNTLIALGSSRRIQPIYNQKVPLTSPSPVYNFHFIKRAAVASMPFSPIRGERSVFASLSHTRPARRIILHRLLAEQLEARCRRAESLQEWKTSVAARTLREDLKVVASVQGDNVLYRSIADLLRRAPSGMETLSEQHYIRLPLVYRPRPYPPAGSRNSRFMRLKNAIRSFERRARISKNIKK